MVIFFIITLQIKYINTYCTNHLFILFILTKILTKNRCFEKIGFSMVLPSFYSII